MPSVQTAGQPAPKKARIPEIDILRALAILAVIMIHATGFMLTKLSRDSIYYVPYSFLQYASSFAVPVFIWISGFVTFYSYLDKPMTGRMLGSFYRKRLLTTVIPYILFSIVYYWFRHPGYDNLLSASSLRHFGYLLLTGGAYTHLYYMFIILQFYLLFPLLLYAAKKCGKHAWIAFLAGTALQWAYYFFNREVVVNLTSIPDVFHKTGSWFLSYMAYYMLGAFLAANSRRFIAFMRFETPFRSGAARGLLWLLVFALWIAAGVYYAYIYYMGNVHKEWAASQTFAIVWFVYNLASAFALFRLSVWAYRRFGAFWRQAFVLLGQCSFGVYLLHPLALLQYRKLSLSGNVLAFNLFFLGELAAALLVTWAVVYFFMRRFRWSWVLFGSSLKPARAAEPLRS